MSAFESDNPDELPLKDRLLLIRSLREGWEITDDSRALAIACLHKHLSDDAVHARHRIAAVRALLAIDEARHRMIRTEIKAMEKAEDQRLAAAKLALREKELQVYSAHMTARWKEKERDRNERTIAREERKEEMEKARVGPVYPPRPKVAGYEKWYRTPENSYEMAASGQKEPVHPIDPDGITPFEEAFIREANSRNHTREEIQHMLLKRREIQRKGGEPGIPHDPHLAILDAARAKRDLELMLKRK